MTETIHPAAVLEHAVNTVFDQVMTEMTVGDLKARISEGIRKAASEFEEGQRQYVEEQLPAYLKDIFLGCGDKTKVEDPDHFRGDAVGLVELNFRKVYHG